MQFARDPESSLAKLTPRQGPRRVPRRKMQKLIIRARLRIARVSDFSDAGISLSILLRPLFPFSNNQANELRKSHLESSDCFYIVP